jgi:hypothetical protein
VACNRLPKSPALGHRTFFSGGAVAAFQCQFNGGIDPRLLVFDLAADSGDFDGNAEPLDKSSKAESWHNLSAARL